MSFGGSLRGEGSGVQGLLTCQGLGIAPFQSLQVQRWPQSWQDLGLELHPLRFGGVSVVGDLPTVGKKKGVKVWGDPSCPQKWHSGCGETLPVPKNGVRAEGDPADPPK